jgi:uncharacterized protein with NAD-binding domain and iron-sulfur cluster
VSERPRVVILGGGMAGLAAAWELSSGEWRERLDGITVYQRGWRLGGKAASSRGRHGRIEEHGLHVLLGYYDATFRVLRQAYGELDRPRTDAQCPIRTWKEAVTPASAVGLADRTDGAWSHFVTRFSGNDREPGEPGAEDRPLRPMDVAVRSMSRLLDFHRSLAAPPATGRVVLRASPPGRSISDGAAELTALTKGGGLTVLAALLEALERAAEVTGPLRLDGGTIRSFDAALRAWREGLRRSVLADPLARRTWQLVDLVVTNLRGMVVDEILTGRRSYSSIDHLDYREWLAGHGASQETLDSAIVRGMYDLVFAYEAGDRTRPRFAAGVGLELAGRILFDFKGSIFWKMRAGMGEVVFAPLYEALLRRGVQFRFFHRLDRLGLSPDRRSIAVIELGRQADLAPGRDRYDPLMRIGGLPCWPARPDTAQLAGDPGDELESHWSSGPDTAKVVLRSGEDFDVAVLAVSLGMVPRVCSELIAGSPAWRDMVDWVATVPTKSIQLWLTADEVALGWDGPGGVILSGFGEAFDTWASMSYLLPAEHWPLDGSPLSVAYFCGVLRDDGPPPNATAARAAGDLVRTEAVMFLADELGALWPGASDAEGFRWELLWDEDGGSGSARLDAQYLRANIDLSDRYVQSLPGSDRYRLRPDRTGFDNLAVAGDWTDCGLNAGCIEAATRAGVLAARAILTGALSGNRGPRGRREQPV